MAAASPAALALFPAASWSAPAPAATALTGLTRRSRAARRAAAILLLLCLAAVGRHPAAGSSQSGDAVVAQQGARSSERRDVPAAATSAETCDGDEDSCYFTLLQKDGAARRALLSHRAPQTPEADGTAHSGFDAFGDRKRCHVVDQPGGGGSVSQCYPDLMLIGNSKCGSTSIAAYLFSHPQVVMQTADQGKSGWSIDSSKADEGGKNVLWESHVFDRHGESDVEVEKANWASAPLIPTDEVGRYLQLQYRPNYFYYPDVPFRIADLFPNARSIKYLLILREPVARAVSGWNFHIEDPRSFDEAIDDGIRQRKALEACYGEELAKLHEASGGGGGGGDGGPEGAGGARRVEELPVALHRSIVDKCFWSRQDTHDTTMPEDSYLGLMCAHVDRGVYVSALRRWFSVLGRENFFVFSLEEWDKDPMGTYLRLADFAGFDAIGPQGFSNASALKEVLDVHWNDKALGINPFPRSEPSKSDTQRLAEFYAPYDEELFELLGRRLW